MWEGEEEEPKADKTPKQRLLQWIQQKVPDKPIHNFTSDWKDGKVMGALVDAVAPGKTKTQPIGPFKLTATIAMAL